MFQAYYLAKFNQEDGYRSLKFVVRNNTQHRLFTHISFHFPGPLTEKETTDHHEESFNNLTKLNPAMYQAWLFANEDLPHTMWKKKSINETHVSLTKDDIKKVDPIVWRHLINQSSIHMGKVRTSNGTEMRYIESLAEAVRRTLARHRPLVKSVKFRNHTNKNHVDAY